MAAAAAVFGVLTDIRKLNINEDATLVPPEDEILSNIVAAMEPRPSVKPIGRLLAHSGESLSSSSVSSDPNKIFT
jgi:hypothetical protein